MYVTRHIGGDRWEKSSPPSITAFNIVVNIKECRLVILELKGKFHVFLFISNVCSKVHVLFLQKTYTVAHLHHMHHITQTMIYCDKL